MGAFIGFPGIFEMLIVGVLIGVPMLVAIVVLFTTLGRRNQVISNPNLKPCPDCHNAVSLRAQCCPHCGCPLKPEA